MDFMTTMQLAAYLKVSEDTARRYCQKHGFRIGRNYGITRRWARAIMFARRARHRKRRRRVKGEYLTARNQLLAKVTHD